MIGKNLTRHLSNRVVIIVNATRQFEWQLGFTQHWNQCQQNFVSDKMNNPVRKRLPDRQAERQRLRNFICWDSQDGAASAGQSLCRQRDTMATATTAAAAGDIFSAIAAPAAAAASASAAARAISSALIARATETRPPEAAAALAKCFWILLLLSSGAGAVYVTLEKGKIQFKKLYLLFAKYTNKCLK